MLRVLLPLALVALTIYAVVDCIQTDQEAARNLPKLGWIALIVLFPPIGAVAWLIAGRPRDGFSGRPGPQRNGRPIGPDDDPDFLRKL